MEYAMHGDLGAWLARKGPQPERLVRREIAGILAVLDALHRGQALHRDLTPFNVFVCENEQLKLGDFGIATHQLTRRGVTADAFNVLNAPTEIAWGKVRRWQQRDDIYQVGLIAVMLLRGDIASPIRSRDVRRLPCSDHLKEVIHRCLGVRGRRYEAAGELMTALQHARTAPQFGRVQSLKGKRLSFTGFLSHPRSEAIAAARRAGAIVQTKPGRATDVLVRGRPNPLQIAGAGGGTKLIEIGRLAAKGHPVTVIGDRQFWRLVRFRTKKHLAVLLYLHFEGRARPIPRDRLVDLLWPDVPAAKGRHSLSQALLAIRSRLGRDAVTGGEEDVQMLAELPSDLSTLQHGAGATMAAEPLRGLEDCGSAEFSHWVDGARARLRIQARDTLRAALQASRARGDTATTQRLAAALYEIDPLCAEAVYALAERSLLDRDTVAALRLLKHHVERARAELGTNPNPEIARLLRRLERGERPAVAGATAALDEGRMRPHLLIGRGAELGRLEAIANSVVDRARPDYETCLISGAPGIGKSSLIRRFATSLQARAWPVFTVSCQEIGQGIPYAGISELITALGRDPAAGGTDPHWLAEATRGGPDRKSVV